MRVAAQQLKDSRWAAGRVRCSLQQRILREPRQPPEAGYFLRVDGVLEARRLDGPFTKSEAFRRDAMSGHFSDNNFSFWMFCGLTFFTTALFTPTGTRS